MLFKYARAMRALCSQAPKPNLINVKVQLGDKSFNFKFPENSKLAPNLERSRVPLDF